jgi:acetyl esterase/lipase
MPFLLNDRVVRPAVLIIPGGGYGCVCETTEGTPIAKKFNDLGFHAFVLDYRVKPDCFPAPQQDAIRAMRLIRGDASKWRVRPDNIAVCGFSAGAHLAACLGTIAEQINADNNDDLDQVDFLPDAMILCYGVLSFAEWSHQDSAKNLLGEQVGELRDQCSLEKQINAQTPPSFIWHTFEDQMVSYCNSVVFAEAMRDKQRPCELHIFPHGPHGMQLGYGRKDIAAWPEQATEFLHGSCGFRFPETPKYKTVILTFDDASKSHFSNVAPVLKKYGFGATFFICRFNDEWRAKHESQLLTLNEIKALSDMGFEIGNHTWNHPDLRQCSAGECEVEITRLNEFLQSAGIVAPVSFAYPGGPYAANAIHVLQKYGIRFARTTERRAWNMGKDDPMQIPAFALQTDDELAFYGAISACTENNAVVLVFHGVPDNVHQFVSTSPPFFTKCMKYLYDNDYRVIGFE